MRSRLSSIYIVIFLCAISAISCAKKPEQSIEPQSALEPAQSDAVRMSDFENRKPLKYTIKTDIQSSNRDNPNDDVVIIVRVISPDNSAIRFDLDCNGDGEYEYISSDKDQKCIYQRNSGNHQIWVRGEIPEMLLCARTCQEDDNNLCTFLKQMMMTVNLRLFLSMNGGISNGKAWRGLLDSVRI